MAESGDWVTPRLYGKPWFEKPPLLYWGGAIFFKLLGEDHPETAARLPSAISALLATLALAWLAWRTYGQECARWLLLLLPTSVGMIGFSHACATDMPFAGMLTIAMVCAAVVLGLVPHTQDTPILPRTPWLALLLFGFFLGLAVLAKGPAGIILIGGAVFFWTLFTKRWRDALRLLHPAAIAAFCLTALPWYILCARRNPDFVRIFIIEHNFKRYLTPEFQHIQPFWFYVPVILIALFPWTVGAVAAVSVKTMRAIREHNLSPTTLFFAAWLIFCVLFFSFSKSKLPGYILPAFPPLVAILVAHLSIINTRTRWLAVANGAVFILTARGLQIGLGRLSNLEVYSLPVTLKIAASVSLIGGIAVILLAALLPSSNTLKLAVFITIVLVFTVMSGDNGVVLDARLSSRWAVNKYLRTHPEESGRGPFTYDLPRGLQYSLNFYFRREVPMWSANDRGEKDVFVSPHSRTGYQSSGLDCQDQGIFPGVVVCHPASSLPGPSGGRQPQ